MGEELAAILLKLIQVGPEVFSGVSKLVPIAEDIIGKVRSGTPPTDDEWSALHDKIDAAREELDAPFEDFE